MVVCTFFARLTLALTHSVVTKEIHLCKDLPAFLTLVYILEIFCHSPDIQFLKIKMSFSRDGFVVICEETIWLHWQITTCGTNQNIGIHSEYQHQNLSQSMWLASTLKVSDVLVSKVNKNQKDHKSGATGTDEMGLVFRQLIEMHLSELLMYLR